eukprot:3768722-Alexandrium_andersonii.AAC.1
MSKATAVGPGCTNLAHLGATGAGLAKLHRALLRTPAIQPSQADERGRGPGGTAFPTEMSDGR